MRSVRTSLVVLPVLMLLAMSAQALTPSVEDDSAAQTRPGHADDVAGHPDDGKLEPSAAEDSGDSRHLTSGSLDDTAGSIEAGRETRGWNLKGDMRLAYTRTDTEERNGLDKSSSEWKGRFRIGGRYSITEKLIVGGRLATSCSSDECNPEWVIDGALPNQSTMDDGDITVDQLYLHSFQREKFDVAIGRLQTKFVTRGGVFAKSLDRLDSNNTNVNWTDGVHGIFHAGSGLTGHVVLQRNQAGGTGNVRRGPIDFNDDDSRITYFFAAENLRKRGPIIQRGLDITYMPQSLMKDGSRDGRIKDYTAVVGRFASSWPQGSTGLRLNISGEIGYAPETPTRAAMGLAGDGDTDGLAWFVSASAMDFRPGHSAGINVGRTDAGWLLSPQYSQNTKALEIRYIWRKSSDFAVDARARWLEDLDKPESATRKQEKTNVFVRLSLGFGG